MVRTADNLTDLYCVFFCQLETDPQPLIKEEEEIREVRWIPLNELYDDPIVSDYTKIIVRKALNSQPMQPDFERDQIVRKRFDLKKYEHFWASE